MGPSFIHYLPSFPLETYRPIETDLKTLFGKCYDIMEGTPLAALINWINRSKECPQFAVAVSSGNW